MGVRRGGEKRAFTPWELGLRTKIYLKTCSEHLVQVN